MKVRIINIDSNNTAGVKPSQIKYKFAVGFDPGFVINETSQHLIYLPTINGREIHNLILKIHNQDSVLVNIRGEEIIIRQDLKELKFELLIIQGECNTTYASESYF